MIIISKHTNQFCNRLFTYLPVISYALEANERVLFLFQYKGYDHLFPNLEKAGYKSYYPDANIKGGIVSKAFNGMVRLVNHFVHIILSAGERIPLHKPLGVLFNPKWREIRYDHAFIEKHAERLRWLFAPQEDVVKKVNTMFGGNAEQYITVGVHIRRGDYLHYKGGRYYYTNKDYRNFMLQMERLLANGGKSVRFFIASNERIGTADFAPLNVFSNKDGDMMTDLYGLAACDYIIGPPSTYSQWASFYGKKPLKMIYSHDERISLDNFTTIKTII